MLFSSTVFLFLFLPLVLLAHYLTPRAEKNLVLILASLVFYFWGEAFFVFVMLASIAANYGFGRMVAGSRTRAGAKRVVALAVVLNLALLCAYKYVDWLLANLDVLLLAIGVSPIEFETQERLPIGISFFTFQALSYVIDVYRGDARVQRNPFNLALYISMFPQLIAGPIVRYRAIADQLENRSVPMSRFALGVRRFVVGLGKKVLIAGPLQVPAMAIFDTLPAENLSAAVVWVGVLCYTLQLYFDFSGYSDMAVGLGHMLGFELPENFDYPFVARSVRDIWRRWHITLTTWFRDYVYFPLGGSLGSSWRTYLNLVSVFVLVGLWHGARWNYVVFGLYHGVFLVLERQRGWSSALARAPRALQHGYTIAVWVAGLVIFRCSSLAQTRSFYSVMLGFEQGGRPAPAWDYLTTETLIVFPIAILCSLPVLRFLRERIDRSGSLPATTSPVLALVCVFAVFLLSVMVMAATTHHPFIYFRF